jgi:hypothetical protein
MALMRFGFRCVLVAIILAGGGPPPARAAREFEKVGTIGAQFLKIGIGARATGMASSFVAVADDPSCLYWNPAGIARLTEAHLSFDQVDWFADTRVVHASCIFHISMFPGAFALQARSLSMDRLPVRTVFRPDGDGTTYDAGDVAIGATYGRLLTDKFSTGITLNYIQSTLAFWTANALCFDFGTLYDTGYRSLRIGMAIRNIGSEMTYIEDPVKLPTIFQVGMSMLLMDTGSQRILASGEFQHPPDNAERACAGIEYEVLRYAALRGGWYFRYDQERFALGAGLKLSTLTGIPLAIDYSYTENRELPGIHRIGVDLQL